MNTVKNLSIALALAFGVTAAAGCAADAPNDVGGEGGGGGGGGGEGSDDAPREMDANGRYQVASQFDLASNMPGKVGVVTNAFIAMTDGADDPSDWILEQVIAQMPNGTLKNLASGARPFVAGYLNDRLLQFAPDFVTTIVQAGNDFGQIAKNFGLNEQLDVTGAAKTYTSKVSAVGVHFKVDNVETDIAFADHSIATIVADNVGVTLDVTGKVSIAEHKLPVSYGKVLRLGLDEVIIPSLDPNASDLNGLLADLVDCQAVGQYINDAIASQFGYGGGAGTWATACNAGLNYGAQTLYSKIDAIDSSALEFGLTGVAKGVDANNDGKMDKIQTGKWTGTLSYSGTPAPLSTATFNGSRM